MTEDRGTLLAMPVGTGAIGAIYSCGVFAAGTSIYIAGFFSNRSL